MQSTIRDKQKTMQLQPYLHLQCGVPWMADRSPGQPFGPHASCSTRSSSTSSGSGGVILIVGLNCIASVQATTPGNCTTVAWHCTNSVTAVDCMLLFGKRPGVHGLHATPPSNMHVLPGSTSRPKQVQLGNPLPLLAAQCHATQSIMCRTAACISAQPENFLLMELLLRISQRLTCYSKSYCARSDISHVPILLPCCQ